jgi:hypothetical protein
VKGVANAVIEVECTSIPQGILAQWIFKACICKSNVTCRFRT